MTTTTDIHPVTRTWIFFHRYARVRVTTVNPVHGELFRGTVTSYNGGYRIEDQDGYEVAECFVGDYLDAEAQLLAATTWADDTTPDPEED